MTKRVSAAQAKAQLSALAAEVAYGGQHVIIERRGKPLVALVSVGDLELLEQDRATSARPQGALALVGTWREVNDKDLESLVEDMYAEREKDTGTPCRARGLMYLLDTDILSNLVKRTPSTVLIARLASVPPEHQFTSSISLGELIYGAHRLRTHTSLLLQRLDKTLPPNLPVLPFDVAAARRYGAVRAELEHRGTPIGDADLRIGAIALARGLTVVTGNVRHFERIPDLLIENWL